MKYKGQLRGKFFKAIGFNGCLLIVFLLIEIFISSGKKAWERKFNIFEKKDE